MVATHNYNEPARKDADGFDAGYIRGYRTAVSNIKYRENPSMRPRGSERFLDGFERGYQAAKEDIRLGRAIKYGRLGIPA